MNETLRQETDETFAHTMQLIATITPEQAARPGVCGEWSACDVVAHMTGWHAEGQAQVQAVLDDTYERKAYDFAAYNANSVAARKGMSWEAIVDEFQRSHTALAAFGDTLDNSVWANKRLHGWFTAVTSHHYPQHYEHLQTAATLPL